MRGCFVVIFFRSRKTPKLDFKIFFIGFNKCGTRSLHKYFSDCGLDSYHGGVHADSHMAILLNISLGLPALEGFDSHDTYLDVGAVQSQFRSLDRDYPGSRFVFNVRNTDHWIVSRLNHIEGRYVDFMNLYYGINLSWQEWVDRWRLEFANHERAVAEHFQDRKDFMRFDVDADRLSSLIRFIGADCLKARDELPREGVTANKYYGLDGKQIVRL